MRNASLPISPYCHPLHRHNKKSHWQHVAPWMQTGIERVFQCNAFRAIAPYQRQRTTRPKWEWERGTQTALTATSQTHINHTDTCRKKLLKFPQTAQSQTQRQHSSCRPRKWTRKGPSSPRPSQRQSPPHSDSVLSRPLATCKAASATDRAASTGCLQGDAPIVRRSALPPYAAVAWPWHRPSSPRRSATMIFVKVAIATMAKRVIEYSPNGRYAKVNAVLGRGAYKVCVRGDAFIMHACVWPFCLFPGCLQGNWSREGFEVAWNCLQGLLLIPATRSCVLCKDIFFLLLSPDHQSESLTNYRTRLRF